MLLLNLEFKQRRVNWLLRPQLVFLHWLLTREEASLARQFTSGWSSQHQINLTMSRIWLLFRTLGWPFFRKLLLSLWSAEVDRVKCLVKWLIMFLASLYRGVDCFETVFMFVSDRSQALLVELLFEAHNCSWLLLGIEVVSLDGLLIKHVTLRISTSSLNLALFEFIRRLLSDTFQLISLKNLWSILLHCIVNWLAD